MHAVDYPGDDTHTQTQIKDKYSLTSLLCQLWDLAESWRCGGVGLEWARHFGGHPWEWLITHDILSFVNPKYQFI